MRTALRVLLVVVGLCLLYPLAVLAFYFSTPRQNATLDKVDTIIVLGCPTKADGSPTPQQRERVLEGVREYERGVSSHIIMTGGAAHNHFVEAHAMALLAEANGVPASAIVEEDQARDTIQNIYYSNKIMEARGWHSAEVISSAYHLPRTALILERYPHLQWTEDAARWPPEYGLWERLMLDWKEGLSCLRIRMHGLPAFRG